MNVLDAASNNDIERLKEILDNGGNVNAVDSCNITALMHAVFHNNVEMAKLLLEHHANPDIQTEDGWTALMHIQQNYSGEATVQIVQLLMERGANPNLYTIYGWNVLMNSVRDRYDDIVEILLKHGMDVNMKNKNGHTAADIAHSPYIKAIITMKSPQSIYSNKDRSRTYISIVYYDIVVLA